MQFTDLKEKIIELFLKYGANPNIQDDNEWTALDYAIIADEKMKSKASKHIIELLKRHGAKTGKELDAERESFGKNKT